MFAGRIKPTSPSTVNPRSLPRRPRASGRTGNGGAHGERPGRHREVLMMGEFLKPPINLKTVGIDPKRDRRVGIGSSQEPQEVRADFQRSSAPSVSRSGSGTSRD